MRNRDAREVPYLFKILQEELILGDGRRTHEKGYHVQISTSAYVHVCT